MGSDTELELPHKKPAELSLQISALLNTNNALKEENSALKEENSALKKEHKNLNLILS